MDLRNRIVDKIPLEKVWNKNKIISREKLKYLKCEDVKTLLKQGEVQLVLANIGFPLDWISIDKNFDFFKTELKNKIMDNEVNCFENFQIIIFTSFQFGSQTAELR